jgi:NAD(P)-dependent dehydrogenase (short-subunit alcohol dehydrogenase family)
MVAGMAKVGRIGRPEDIAGAVLYLASPESAYVIGAEIIVDGGYSIVT